MAACQHRSSLQRCTTRGRPAPFQSHAVSRRIVNAGLASVPLARATRVMAAAASGDLLIVGPGVLGSYLGKLWLDGQHGAVVGQTNTTNNHDRLQKLGITPRTKDQAGDERYPYVVFSAPPSGSADYPAEVKAALDAWDKRGAFVFTSSNSVCNVNDGSLVTEETPTVAVGAGPSTDKLLAAEAAVLEAGGKVVRFVGLYHCNRGAHTYFLKMGQVPRPPGYVVNLIHYEDAAGLTYSALKDDGSADPFPQKPKVYLGCDNQPITFKDMMDACTSSGVFQGEVTFTAPDTPDNAGKRVDNSLTRERLQWQPKYPTFQDFMAQGGKDFYNTSGLY